MLAVCCANVLGGSTAIRFYDAGRAKMRIAGVDGWKRLPFSCAIGVAGRAEKEEHDAMRMYETEVYDYARQLLEAHGEKDVAEAAQKADALETLGKSEEAEAWRRIEATLKLMRGPHES